MEQLNIQIPEGKEIDWENTNQQNGIVLRDRKITRNQIWEHLFKNKDIFYISGLGDIKGNMPGNPVGSNLAVSEHQLACILAKNELANVARYLNGNWRNFANAQKKFSIRMSEKLDNKISIGLVDRPASATNVIFKSEELAQQAIDILGEKTIRLALEPLY
jgi:hypothetical protein